jgi:hypothetical protein
MTEDEITFIKDLVSKYLNDEVSAEPSLIQEWVYVMERKSQAGLGWIVIKENQLSLGDFLNPANNIPMNRFYLELATVTEPQIRNAFKSVFRKYF